MFNIGLGELLFIAILALIFIGPERLPRVMRQLGELVYQVRELVGEINNQFSEELRPLQEIQSLANELNPTRQIGNLIDPANQNRNPTANTPAQLPPTLPTNTIRAWRRPSFHDSATRHSQSHAPDHPGDTGAAVRDRSRSRRGSRLTATSPRL